ncbi:MAG: proline--tRNA ligase [Anaerolineae bacterium]|nr:proline--tRNA ligase [Anaerolineae bacterium]
MRISQLFGRTLRDAPADAELPSHRLAVRGGFARPISAGIYALMPLGWRVFRKIGAIIREEMDAIGGQEMLMPVLNPAELWQATGRWASFGPVLQKLANRDGRDFALAATHEEVVTALALREIDSYRQLPQIVYHIQTKVRDEVRPRGGLIRLREFTMKDAYTLDPDVESLQASYKRVYQAYINIFERVGLRGVVPVEADTGLMGGSASHEFVIPNERGEDSFVMCDRCSYAANVETAEFIAPPGVAGDLLPMEKVATPDCKTIADVAAFVGVPTRQTLKAVFYMHDPLNGASEQFVFALVRGDLEINETRVINALGGGLLRPAEEHEIEAAGATPGYASPAGLKVRKTGEPGGVPVLADRSIKNGANFVVGANDAGYHHINANYPRDFDVTAVVDIAEAADGLTCARCGAGTLHIHTAIELGHCFMLGTRYSEAVGATYDDAEGKTRPIVMGSYGIGLERLMAVIIEQHHDEHGIIWPASVAPFEVHLLTLGRSDAIHERGGALYEELRAAGLDVLLDDRRERAGVKFNDADLVGAPLRLTLSENTLEAGEVEYKRRHAGERGRLPLDGLAGQLRAMLDDLSA